jgi:endonuclease IV
MRYCNSCGERIVDDAKFCSSCGTKLDDYNQKNTDKPIANETQKQDDNTQETATPTTPTVDYQDSNYIPYNPYYNNLNQQPQVEKASGSLNVGMLVWSIINTLICCMPLGVISLIFTILANSASSATEEKSKVKTALILNIIGSAAFVIFIILYIVFIVIMIASESGDINYY